MDNRGDIYPRRNLFAAGSVAAALDVLQAQRNDLISMWQRGHYDHVIFTGCGSTYYLALAAAALFQELSGQPARALPASELWLSPRSSYARRARPCWWPSADRARRPKRCAPAKRSSELAAAIW